MEAPEIIWHGRRYWVSDPTGDQITGWNTRFEPCWVMSKTSKRIQILSPSLGKMFLDREAFERDGKVYHSKPHEWFYAQHPKVDPEKAGRQRAERWQSSASPAPEALALLGLSLPTTKAAIKKAYKQLAQQRHPDGGGSHEAFIELNNAYKSALRHIPL